MTPSAGPIWRSTLTFQVCIRPLSKFGSTDFGASPAASAVAAALPRRMLPANVQRRGKRRIRRGQRHDVGDGLVDHDRVGAAHDQPIGLDGLQMTPTRGCRL